MHIIIIEIIPPPYTHHFNKKTNLIIFSSELLNRADENEDGSIEISDVLKKYM